MLMNLKGWVNYFYSCAFFKHNFDSERLFEKYKARLVDRGDMQELNKELNATTLAAQTFRALMAITTFDAVNAFVNASLPSPIYDMPRRI